MKKLAIALLALVMVLTTVLVPILADNEATVVGYSDARVKKADLTNVKNIKEYDKDNVEPGYKITDADGLKKFSELVNGGQSFQGSYIYLAKDIDMAGVEGFLPIGDADFEITDKKSDDAGNITEIVTVKIGTTRPFKGVFNGHGHVIDNLVINVSSAEVLYAGFFGLADGATITNLVLGEGCSVTQTIVNAYSAAGGITGKSSGVTFDNVLNAADVTNDGPHAAGFFGRGAATIRNSTNMGDMSAQNSGAGFGGFNEGKTTVENCRNTGTMMANTAAGIVSRLRGGPIVIKNCINNGKLMGKGVAAGIGGLADWPGSVITIENCVNYGELLNGDGTAPAGRGDAFCVANEKNGDKEITPPTITGCTDKTGEEDATNVAIDITCNSNQEEDGVGDGETAYVTTTAPFEQVEGVITDPTGEEVGYSSFHVEEVDTTKIVDILNYNERPTEDAYKITNAAGFLALDEQLYNYATFSTVTFYLANDIDMSEVQGFQPISNDLEHVKQVNGSPRYYFAGTLDGQGEAICNLVMNSKEDPLKFDENGKVDMENGKVEAESIVCVGLFGVAGGIYKNLIIDESCEFGYVGTAANPCVAALVARNSGGVEFHNVWNRAKLNGGRFIGAFIGRVAGKYTFVNCTNTGDVMGAQMVGGFIGYDGSGGSFENCRNAGNVKRVGAGNTYHTCSAGFVARARAGVRMTGCINNGIVEGNANCGAFLGTIAAENFITDCTNYGSLIASVVPESIGVMFAAQEADAEGKLKGSCEPKNVQDKTGTQDPTLAFEVVEIDFTIDPGNIGIPETEATSATEATTKKPGSTTKAPGGNGGNVSTTKAPGGVSTTAAPAGDNTTDDTTEKKGCGSTVFGGVAVIMIVSGAALTLFKKKED